MSKEIPNFFALEGLDGVGKSTIVAKLKEKGYVVLKTPPEQLLRFRSTFDNKDLKLRFLYYVVGVIYASKQAVDINREAAKFCDRYLLTTVAAHEAMGMSPNFISLVFPVIRNIPRPEATFLFTADEKVRMQRLLARGANENDIQNLKINSKLLTGYFEWSRKLEHKLVVVDTTTLNPDEVARSIEYHMYEKSSG